MRHILLAALLAALPSLAFADDFTDQLGEARAAYERHDFKTAAAALDAANALLRQTRAEQWKTYLPEPLPGWIGEEVSITTAGPALFGGGTAVSRRYHRKDEGSVEVTIVGDSPMLAAFGGVMRGVLGNLVSSDEMRPLVIDGHATTYAKSDNAYIIIVAGRVVVNVKGIGVADDDLRAYVKAVKYAAIEEATR